jgi:hypothetical protein
MTIPIENQISSTRRIFGIIATMIGAVVIGGIIAFAAQYVYLIILFPLLMATAAGTLTAIWATEQKNRLIVVMLALALGLIIYGAYRYGEYLLFIRDLDVSVTFWEFITLTAKLGISISRRSTEISLNEGMTWAYWGLELLLVVGVSVWGAFEIRKNLKQNLQSMNKN